MIMNLSNCELNVPHTTGPCYNILHGLETTVLKGPKYETNSDVYN
jgi:hypothetical protein